MREGHHRAVSLDVRAEGPKQVLQITNYVAEQSLYKPKRRNTGSIGRAESLRADSMYGSQEAFEAVTEEVSPSLAIKMDLKGIGISLMNHKMVEVIYLSVNNLKCEYASSAVAQSVTIACGTVQVDNQLHDAIFPVVLQPTPMTGDSGGVAALPTLQASFIWLNDQGNSRNRRQLVIPCSCFLAEHGVFFIKYCSILLQALTIEADEDFLFAVYEMAQFPTSAWEATQEESALLSSR